MSLQRCVAGQPTTTTEYRVALVVPCNPQSQWKAGFVRFWFKMVLGRSRRDRCLIRNPFFVFFKAEKPQKLRFVGEGVSVSLFCCSVMRAAVAAFVLLCQNKVRYWLIYNWGYANQTWYATGQYLISAECITLLSDKPCVPRSSI